MYIKVASLSVFGDSPFQVARLFFFFYHNRVLRFSTWAAAGAEEDGDRPHRRKRNVPSIYQLKMSKSVFEGSQYFALH